MYSEKGKAGNTSTILRVESIQLVVHVLAALMSWFEDRPLRLRITQPSITVEIPPNDTEVPSSKHGWWRTRTDPS